MGITADAIRALNTIPTDAPLVALADELADQGVDTWDALRRDLDRERCYAMAQRAAGIALALMRALDGPAPPR